MVIAMIAIGAWIIAVVLLLCILGEIRRSIRELELTMIEFDEATEDMPPAPDPEALRHWLN
jgi:hypothetical protein